MPKWKIIVPVLVIIGIAVFVYMRTSTVAPEDAAQDETTGEVMEDDSASTGDPEVDAVVDDIMVAAEAESEAAAAVEDEGDIATEGQGDNELYGGEYYAE